jgi:hypothetical protein
MHPLWVTMLLATLLTAAPAFSTELSEVLATSRVSPPASVTFQEERHNPLFEQPLILDGYLEYVGPGRLRKVIESPFQEALSIEAGELLITRDGETHRLPVKRNKALEALLGAFEALLSGDAVRLEAVFDYQVTGDVSDWAIDLTPKSRRIGRHLSSLQVNGDSSGVGRILIRLRDGEWHVMSIRHEVPSL